MDDRPIYILTIAGDLPAYLTGPFCEGLQSLTGLEGPGLEQALDPFDVGGTVAGPASGTKVWQQTVPNHSYSWAPRVAADYYNHLRVTGPQSHTPQLREFLGLLREFEMTYHVSWPGAEGEPERVEWWSPLESTNSPQVAYRLDGEALYSRSVLQEIAKGHITVERAAERYAPVYPAAPFRQVFRVNYFAVDHTAYLNTNWPHGVYIRRAWAIYAYSPDRETYCCELTPSYECWPCGYEFEGELWDGEIELTDEQEAIRDEIETEQSFNDDDIAYFHVRAVTHLRRDYPTRHCCEVDVIGPRVTFDAAEDHNTCMEDAVQYYREGGGGLDPELF